MAHAMTPTDQPPKGIEVDLDEALLFLLEEAGNTDGNALHHFRRHMSSDVYIKFTHLKRLLCARPAQLPLPEHVATALDRLLCYDLERRLAYDVRKLEYAKIDSRNRSSIATGPLIGVWKGDIRDIANATAIVNAANNQLLGCFQPDHACIDNAIHALAGPQLRQACLKIMTSQGHLEPEGRAKVTPGFNLRAKHVLHTVGPQMRRGTQPSTKHEELLASCYQSCLAAVEDLPANPDGTKSIVFCGISTGLFGFPRERASEIAVESVLRYLETDPDSSITHIVFDAFSGQDLTQYRKVLHGLNIGSNLQFTNTHMLPAASSRISMSRKWFKEADFVIISAGAGLSADAGLDYTSREHFAKWLPGFMKYGFGRLYDVFGFDDWPNPQARWSYLVNHLLMVRDYPRAQVYDDLMALLQHKFNESKVQAEIAESERFFIRTTNADGFFEKHGFPTDLIATPQGQYKYLQCVNKCQPDVVYPSQQFVEQAEPLLDAQNQHLPENFQVPTCPHCGSDLVLWVRGGDYFNDVLCRTQEQKYEQLMKNLSQDTSKKVTILELGVGMNTPSVLRWHNEDIVRRSDGHMKLIRFGLGPAGYAPLDLEETGRALGLEGRVSELLALLKES